MDVGVGSLISAAAGGGGIGIAKMAITSFIQWRRDVKADEVKREEKRDALISSNAIEFQQKLNESPAILADTSHESKFIIKLFGTDFGWDVKKVSHDVVGNPARDQRSLIVLLLVLTFATVCIIFADDPLIPLWTVPPSVEPETRSLFWGLFTWTSFHAKVFVITTGGAAFLLLHPLIGTITFWLVQVPMSYIRGRK